MRKRPDGLRWAFLHRVDIPDMQDPNATYLTRWRLVECPWFGVYLHAIRIDDSDRHLHNHPWAFCSLVLRGGYVEAGPHPIGLEELFTDSDNPQKQAFRVAGRAALARPSNLSRSPYWSRTRDTPPRFVPSSAAR